MSSINQKPVSLEEERHIFDLADKAVYDSLEDGNFDFAAEVISSYRSMSRASELGISKVLHGVNAHFLDVQHEDGETFFKWSVRNSGYVIETVEKHIGVWEMLSGDYIPPQYLDQIKSQTMRQLVRVYGLTTLPKKNQINYDFLTQDYVLENDDWLALSEASDERRVSEIVSKIKDKPRNKNFMSLKISKDGDIFAYQGNEVVTIGFLDVHTDDPLIYKAIKRITSNSGITERDEF